MRKDTVEPMKNLSPQQRNEAEKLFSRALQSAKANDYVAAAQYYKQAAGYGHPGAQNNLGNLYKNGRGVNRDLQEAVRLFEASARQGSVFGMRNLASCYMDGVGIGKDFDSAVDWLETAAEQKDNLACAMLAKAYGSWNHENEEKRIFWHKKAAEYGNVDSMFALGEYYGKKGDNQDLSLASAYYDNAAKYGTPEMKLKVAKAFDMPSYDNETAISLEKAKYWYNELLTCDNDNIALAAAEGLDEMSGREGTVRRPALDIGKAYMAYRVLAMKGNKSACLLAAYYSEVGKGTDPKIDTAIMFYEKAGKFEEAEWCKKKKSGNLEDQVYKANVENVMPERIPDPYSHGKEYYRTDVDLDLAEYNGLFYFIKRQWNVGTFLCSSDKEGNNVKIISEIPDEYDYASIHINCTGIYLYYTQDYDRLLVLHLDHDGNKISECRDEYDGGHEDGHHVHNVYFYGNDAFYTYKHYGDDEEKCVIKCMHVDTDIIDVMYERASSISKLYVTDGYLIFNAEYSNEDCEQSQADGWMLLNMLTNDIECISNPYCSPENILDNPSYYDPESSDYNKNCDFDRRIVSFDLSRKIFWIERSVLEGDDSAHLDWVKYWEPRSLWGNRDELVSGMPVWRITKDLAWSTREYFDGVIHYWDEGYFRFRSSDKYGQVFDWSEGNGGHGVCDKYKIVGGYLFLNVAAYSEKQYPLTVGISSPIRKSWFDNELSQNVIDAFRNPDFDLHKEEKRLEQEKMRDGSFDMLLDNSLTEKSRNKTGIGEASEQDLYAVKTIGNTDVKYNICTFGARFHIGFGVPVTVKINEHVYSLNMHKTAKGRIDGMKKLYAENGIKVGTVLKAAYNAKNQEIILELQ